MIFAKKNLILIALIFISSLINGMFKDESDNSDYEGEGIEESEIIIEEESPIESLKDLALAKIEEEFLNCLHTGKDSKWLNTKALPLELEKEIKEILFKNNPSLFIKLLSYQLSDIIECNGRIYAFTITQDNKFIIAATDREIITVDIKTGKLINKCSIEHDIPNSHYVNTVYDAKLLNKMAISNDGTLVAGFTNNTLQIWSAESGICLHSIDTGSQILSVIFDQNNNAVTLNLKILPGVWCRPNRKDWQAIYIWDLDLGKCIHKYKTKCRYERIIKIISHDNKIYALCREGNNSIWHSTEASLDTYTSYIADIQETHFYPMVIKSNFAYNAGSTRYDNDRLKYTLEEIDTNQKKAKWNIKNKNASSDFIFYNNRPGIIALTVADFQPLAFRSTNYYRPFSKFKTKGGWFPNRSHGGVMLSDDSIAFIKNKKILEMWDISNPREITLCDKIEIVDMEEVIISTNNYYLAVKRPEMILIFQMSDLDKLSLAEILSKHKEKEEEMANPKKSNCVLA